MPLPPDHDQGTEAESLVHSIIMPLPEQVVEGVEDLPGLGDELDDDDGVATTGAALDGGGATAILFATMTELVAAGAATLP